MYLRESAFRPGAVRTSRRSRTRRLTTSLGPRLHYIKLIMVSVYSNDTYTIRSSTGRVRLSHFASRTTEPRAVEETRGTSPFRTIPTGVRRTPMWLVGAVAPFTFEDLPVLVAPLAPASACTRRDDRFPCRFRAPLDGRSWLRTRSRAISIAPAVISD